MGYDSKAFVVYTRYPLLANRRNDNKKTRKPVQNSKRPSPNSRPHPQSARVTEYRKPVNINIGMIIFMVILIYVMYSIFRYATAKHVVGYEVRTGSISANRVYQGLALREEEVVNSEYSGYINYYSSETERLSAGSLAYTVDESGQIQ